MRNKIRKVIIAKDGFPLEQIIGRPITNFFRRLLLSSHIECKSCYEIKNNIKISD
jgi:hypothetical protein